MRSAPTFDSNIASFASRHQSILSCFHISVPSFLGSTHYLLALDPTSYFKNSLILITLELSTLLIFEANFKSELLISKKVRLLTEYFSRKAYLVVSETSKEGPVILPEDVCDVK